ncbi:RTKN protein, partial [Bucorvus abyssinicus]|nr:RTKN protein [Bucorvus abyssinicus]
PPVPTPQDTETQRKLERELRLREGALKLLGACSRPEQALEAAKGLLLANARVLAYMGELQRRKEAQVLRRTARRPSDASPSEERLPCRGTVCVSGMGVPQRMVGGHPPRGSHWVQWVRPVPVICAPTRGSPQGGVGTPSTHHGCTLQGGGAGGGAGWSCGAVPGTSLGRSSGRRVRAAMDGPPGSPPANGGTGPLLLPTPSVPGPKFHLLAHAVLSLAEVQDGFRTHDLTVANSEESSCWVPLYGSMCCRLVAQPRCMATPASRGFLRLQQQPGTEGQSGALLFCVLRGTDLLCYRDPGEADAGLEPALTIAVNKETRVRATEREGRGQPHGVAVTNRLGGEEVTHTLVAESQAEAQRWMEAFWQHFYDMSQWKQCCEGLMRIEVPPPRRPPA